MTDLDAIDYFRDTSVAVDPYPYLDALVREQPVWIEPRYGVAMVTGYDEALDVLRHPETFSSCNNVAGPVTKFPAKFEGDDITGFVEQHRGSLPFSDQIVTFDPPVHTAHRALLMGLITPKRLKENEEFIWRITDRMLDRVLPQGRCEFIADFAQPYTLLVIADLLGVPEEDHASLLNRTGLGEATLGDTESDRDNHGGLEHLYDYFVTRIEERRAQPRGDVLTGMARAAFPDGTVPEAVEVARIASNLFAAGQETTVRLLGAAVQLLGDNPELQDRLRAEPALISRFIEETLRIEGPIKGPFRLTLKTTNLGGVRIPAGTTVFLANGAANRDPRQFECPAELRIDRPNARRHMAFGHGIHTCPGAPLARAEVRVGLERLLGRTAKIRIDEGVHGPAGARRYDYMTSFMFRALTTINIEYTLAP
jgi:cytochrome P450 family 150 subfamily A5